MARGILLKYVGRLLKVFDYNIRNEITICILQAKEIDLIVLTEIFQRSRAARTNNSLGAIVIEHDFVNVQALKVIQLAAVRVLN